MINIRIELQVDHLIKASKTVPSIHAMIDQEIESKTVRHGGNTRSLLRVIRGLDVTRLFCENLLTQTYVCTYVCMYDHYICILNKVCIISVYVFPKVVANDKKPSLMTISDRQ